MQRWRKFAGLKRAEQILVVQAAVLLAAVRVGIAVLPFQSLRRLVRWAARPSTGSRGLAAVSVDQIAWAIDVAGEHVPHAGTCLPRALAGQVLLGRYSFPAQVHMGIARAASGLIEGHAWVECDGKIVIGGTELSHFTRIAAFEKGNL